jgi:hypothetical protein
MPASHAPATLNASKKQPPALGKHLDQHLLSYIAAAGAAGVSVLGTAQPANAKVVYTPANRTIIFNGHSYLDLNNDGIPEFGFSGYGLGNVHSSVIFPIKFNKMLSFAEPLPAGVSVGPGGNFKGGRQEMDGACFCSGYWDYFGPWLGVQNEYMGVEFNIRGAAHFGWARFSVTSKGAVTLTGYAYETVSLKPIVTGDEGGGNDEDSASMSVPAATLPAPQPASLGRLAQGAAGLTAWRREEEVTA